MQNSKGNKIAIVKRLDFTAICFAVIAIIGSSAVYSSSTSLSTSAFQNVLILMNYALLFIALLFSFFTFRFKFSITILCPIAYVLISYFDSYEETTLKVFQLVLLSFFLCQKYETLYKSLLYYRTILIWFAAIGGVMCLAWLGGIPVPYRTVSYYTSDSATVYIDLFIAYVAYGGGMPRFCSIFNEPGFFGTISALLLCLDNMNFKRVGNWILLISGMLSFSIAFFILVFIGLFMKMSKNLARVAAFGIIMLISVSVLQEIEISGPFGRVVERLQYENGDIVGNNRSTDMVNNELSNVLSSTKIVWGEGGGYTRMMAERFRQNILTIKSYIIDYGLVGFLLMFGSCFFFAFKNALGNRFAMFFLFCFCLSAIQRPNIFNLQYFIVLFGGLIYIKSYLISKKTERKMIVKQNIGYERQLT